MADFLITLALAICGLFSLALGSIHFFMPLLFDFRNALPADGPALKPFRLGPIRYPTQRSDVYGLAWVMNHATSYVLVSIGLADLLSRLWLALAGGRWLALWMAGWWLLRAGTQFYLGRRRGDWQIAGGFALLAAIHGAAFGAAMTGWL